jgi:hypothetical protein
MGHGKNLPMKNTLRKLLYIFSIFLELSLPIFSQRKSEITFGLAFPEMSNVKIKYGTDFQVGAGLGFVPVINFLTITGDMYYNFPKKPENTNPNTWNINLGGTFINIIQTGDDEKVLIFYSKLGRRLNFKNGRGINFDFGLGLGMSPGESNSTPLGGSGGLSMPEDSSISLFPVGGISYFIRF